MTICFEGLDHSGKTTQLSMLEEVLIREGYHARRSRTEVLDSLLAKRGPLTLALKKMSITSLSDEVISTLYFAQQVSCAEEYRNSPSIIWLIDRGIFSMAAYASVMCFQHAFYFEKVVLPSFEVLPHPDLTFFLDGCFSKLETRAQEGVPLHRYELLSPGEQKVLYENFRRTLALSRGKVVMLDAFDGKNELHKKVRSITLKFLKDFFYREGGNNYAKSV